MQAHDGNTFVTWRRDGGLAIITFNNPPLNVLSRQVLAEFDHCVAKIEQDETVVCVVVTGAGDRAFVAGADIKELSQLLEQGGSRERVERSHAIFGRFTSLIKPTIAAVNGLALGGGCELALLCDMRIAAESAQFAMPEIKLGLMPGGGGTQRLPRLVGAAKAKELMFTARHIDAREALEIGLVNALAPEGKALQVAVELGRHIAQRAGKTLAFIKQAVDEGGQLSLGDGLALERELFVKVFETDDARDGVQAFLEKRQPQFRNR